MLRAHRFLAIASFLFLLGGCIVVMDDTPENRYKYGYTTWEDYPNSGTYEFVECTATLGSASLCGNRPGLEGKSNPTYAWQSNCHGSDCEILNVLVRYSLLQNLGTNRTLTIEAFQNAGFTGTPVANIRIYGFDASHPNASNLEEMYLAPGEYYFRAYLATDDSQPIPYPLNGMVLVGDEPVGVYGALSGAQRVLVEADQKASIINIDINQLFKKPNSEAESNAHIRLHLTVEGTDAVPTNRDVKILLLKSANIDSTPAYSFTLSSNLLLVKGQEGTVDYVTPSLDVASYYVFVYLDADGNGFYEPTELGAFFIENQAASALPVERDNTRTLQLELQANATPNPTI